MSLARTWMGTVATNGVILAATLIGGVAAARLLGPQDRGVLAALMFWPGLVAGVGALGLSESAVSLMSPRGRAEQLPAAFAGLANIVGLTVALAGTGLIAAASGVGALPIVAAPPVVFALIYGTICANALNGVYHAEGRYGIYNLLRVFPIAAYPALIGLAWVLGHATVTSTLAAYLGSVASAVIAGHLFLRDRIRLPTPAQARRVLATGLRFHGPAITMLLLGNLDRAVAIVRLDAHDVGVYFVAQAWTAMATASVLQPLRIVFLRHVSEETDPGRRLHRVRRALLILALSLAAVTVTSIAAAKVLLPLVFGAEFAAAVPITVPLQLAQFPLMMRSAIALFAPFVGQVRTLILSDLAAMLLFACLCAAVAHPSGVTLAVALGVAQAAGLAAALAAPSVRTLLWRDGPPPPASIEDPVCDP